MVYNYNMYSQWVTVNHAKHLHNVHTGKEGKLIERFFKIAPSCQNILDTLTYILYYIHLYLRIHLIYMRWNNYNNYIIINNRAAVCMCVCV